LLEEGKEQEEEELRKDIVLFLEMKLYKLS
jgi:hypothetical protein